MNNRTDTSNNNGHVDLLTTELIPNEKGHFFVACYLASSGMLCFIATWTPAQNHRYRPPVPDRYFFLYGFFPDVWNSHSNHRSQSSMALTHRLQVFWYCLRVERVDSESKPPRSNGQQRQNATRYPLRGRR